MRWHVVRWQHRLERLMRGVLGLTPLLIQRDSVQRGIDARRGMWAGEMVRCSGGGMTAVSSAR